VWQSAAELARRHGIYVVARSLRLDYSALKKQVNGSAAVPTRGRKKPQAKFLELIGAARETTDDYVMEFEIGVRPQAARPVQDQHAAGLAGVAACLAKNGTMIQITPQMRVLVALEPVDGRKGIDSLAQLCQEQLAEDPFSGCVFVTMPRSGTNRPPFGMDALELPRDSGPDCRLRSLMPKPRKNHAREERIENEMEDKIHFPFQAKCITAKVVSPLGKGTTVEVLRLAPDGACTGDMLVLIRWHDRNVAVPLSQLTAIDENESTDQAIADWQYWVAQGYLF
jgi:Calcium binding/IS66 Orf2 like protein